MFNQTGPQWGSEFLVCGNKNCFWSWTACYAEIPLLLPTGHWLSLGDGGDTGAHGDKHSLWVRSFFVVGSPLLVGDREFFPGWMLVLVDSHLLVTPTGVFLCEGHRGVVEKDSTSLVVHCQWSFYQSLLPVLRGSPAIGGTPI